MVEYKVKVGKRTVFREHFRTKVEAKAAIRDARVGAKARGHPHAYSRARVVKIITKRKIRRH